MVDTSSQGKAEIRPMSDTERQDAMRMQREGRGVREIARHFNRAPSTISRILRAAGASATATQAGTAKTSRGPARRAATAQKPRTAARAKATTARGAATQGKAATARGAAAAAARGKATTARAVAARGKAKVATRKPAGRPAANKKAPAAAASGVPRQELRSLEQRIARIERSLSQLGTTVRPARKR